MRDILFRGKDPDDGRWYTGNYMALSETTYCFSSDYDLHPDNTKHYIVFDQMTDWGLPNRHMQATVDPNTVGQFTGQTDKNGKRIFEGDIVKFKRTDALGWTRSRIGKVLYYDNLPIFYILATTGDAWDWVVCEEIEVVGNIYDNPELLEVSI